MVVVAVKISLGGPYIPAKNFEEYLPLPSLACSSSPERWYHFVLKTGVVLAFMLTECNGNQTDNLCHVLLIVITLGFNVLSNKVALQTSVHLHLPVAFLAFDPAAPKEVALAVFSDNHLLHLSAPAAAQ